MASVTPVLIPLAISFNNSFVFDVCVAAAIVGCRYGDTEPVNNDVGNLNAGIGGVRRLIP